MGGIVRGITNAVGGVLGFKDNSDEIRAASQEQASAIKAQTDAQVTQQQENTRLMQQQIQQQAESSRNALQNSVAQQQAANEASQLQADAAPESKPVSVTLGGDSEADPRRRYFNQRSAASGANAGGSGGVGISLK